MRCSRHYSVAQKAIDKVANMTRRDSSLGRMSSKLTGGCQCGYVRYSISGEPIRLNICHCADCQTQSGSAFGMSLVINPDTLSIDEGLLREFELTADSGRTKTCAFCPKCGVRIYNRTSALCSLKAGTLDDTSSLEPDAQYWTKSKQGWSKLSSNIPSYETHE